MYEKKHSIYRVEYYPLFQASTEGLVMYPPMEKGKILYCFILASVKSGLEWSRSFNEK